MVFYVVGDDGGPEGGNDVGPPRPSEAETLLAVQEGGVQPRKEDDNGL